MRVRAGFGIAVLAVTAITAHGLGRNESRAQAPAEVQDAPASIPLPEIARRTEEVGALLRSLEVQLPPNPHVKAIEAEMPELSERLRARFEWSRQMVETRPELGVVDTLVERWQAARLDLRSRMEVLTARAVWLEQQRARLIQLSETWTRTRADARAARVPEPVAARIDDVRASLAAAQARVEAERTETLLLQERIARELARCEDALALIGRARQRATSDLFVRDSLPLWSLHRDAAGGFVQAIGTSLSGHLSLLRQFVADQSARILMHVGVFLGLAMVLLWVRRVTRAGPAWATPLGTIFARPVAAALILALLASSWIYSGEPDAVRTLIGVIALAPTVIVLRGIMAPVLAPWLYALAAFFLTDRVRELLIGMPLIERPLFLLETLAAVVAQTWLIRSGRAREVAAAFGSSMERVVPALFGLGLLGFLIAFLAGIVGNMSLARLLESGLLTSAYLGLVMLVAYRLAEGLIVVLLRVRPLRLLGMVLRHRAVLEYRAHLLVRALAILGWLAGTLEYFRLLEPVRAGAARILAAEVSRGALHLSVGDVVAFVVTVWAGFALSRLIRFVLDEDVFPHLRLSPGLPYALSSVIGYTIVFVGFIAAILVLGVNLDRVTILGGAFGVGVGFGLQNVVNNFVSGLIVLLERPVRVGDAVQIGDVQGEVRRIGIRSSTVRAWQGAEVIVPNSMLVAEKVTNWTPVDRRRRIDLAVNVAYGCAPDKVLKVLAEVAHANPDVADVPAPQAVFIGFGDNALRFELWAWTHRLDRHMMVKSDLGVAAYAALQNAGVAVAGPRYDVRLYRDPETPT
ncbi:MAG TPA: mechanosensitive ion channel domain-containing protein [Methylomirabilota bacterium]|jgi:small-conductance mechanosensitive channel